MAYLNRREMMIGSSSSVDCNTAALCCQGEFCPKLPHTGLNHEPYLAKPRVAEVAFQLQSNQV